MRSDAIIIGRAIGDNALGYYSVALDLARIPVDRFVMMLNQVCFPVFSKLQQDFESLKNYFLKITEFVSLVVFPMSVGAALLSKEIVFLVLTSKWEPIIEPFAFLCVLSLFQSLAGIISMLLNALGHSRTNMIFALIGAVALPIAFVISVRFGIIGVAASWLIVYPLLFAHLLQQACAKLHITMFDFCRAIKTPVLAVTLMTSFVLGAKALIGFDRISISYCVFYVAVGAGSYLFYIAIFSPKTFRSIGKIFSELRSQRDLSPAT
jgi:O-antigen/teichoic acid export membrane protein